MTADAAPTAPPTPRRPRFVLVRTLCYGYVTFMWTLFCFVFTSLGVLLAPRSGRWSYAAARLWARGYIASIAAGVEVEHAERLDPNTVRMVVANHASWLDPPALMVAFPGQMRFVLKRELLKVPFVGWHARQAGHFLLDRSNPREGKRVLERAVARAKAYKLSPVVFPEGTRTRDGLLATFKTGAFQLAIAAGIEVQPIAVLDTYEILPRGATFPRRSGTIRVRVGKPISIEGCKGSPGRQEISRRVREALIELGVRDT